MTKHQAISLKLAQWLGYVAGTSLTGESSTVSYLKHDLDESCRVFNPFASSTEGRAQFADCWERACIEEMCPTVALAACIANGDDEKSHCVKHDGLKFREGMLEAIYYAIGGTDTEWSDEK